MKKFLKAFLFVGFVGIALHSCAPADAGLPPDIDFWVGPGYVSGDTTLAVSSTVKIGIFAAKSEGEDILKTFDISKSINGAANASIFNMAVPAAQEDLFIYNYTGTVGTTPGNTEKFTFTVTSRDGITNQAILTVTLQ